MSETSTPEQKFSIQKLYVKDASFESPAAPQSFHYTQWNPKVDLNLSNKQTQIDEGVYEIVLSVTATVTQDEATAYLVEVHQAGLFQISGFDNEHKGYLLGSQCMNILFPYVREVISDLSVRGGFPPLVMTPVNFDALYQQHVQQQGKSTDENTAATEVTH